jgi:hypothetical protein
MLTIESGYDDFCTIHQLSLLGQRV